MKIFICTFWMLLDDSNKLKLEVKEIKDLLGEKSEIWTFLTHFEKLKFSNIVRGYDSRISKSDVSS